MVDNYRLIIGKGIDNEPLILLKYPGTSTCIIPLCRSCLRGTGKRKPLHISICSPTVEHVDVIKEGGLLPGDCVSIDQL